MLRAENRKTAQAKTPLAVHASRFPILRTLAIRAPRSTVLNPANRFPQAVQPDRQAALTQCPRDRVFAYWALPSWNSITTKQWHDPTAIALPTPAAQAIP